MFIDSAIGAPIIERLRTLGVHNVIEVNFREQSPDDHFENRRASMWSDMKDWLLRGASIRTPSSKSDVRTWLSHQPAAIGIEAGHGEARNVARSDAGFSGHATGSGPRVHHL